MTLRRGIVAGSIEESMSNERPISAFFSATSVESDGRGISEDAQTLLLDHPHLLRCVVEDPGDELSCRQMC